VGTVLPSAVVGDAKRAFLVADGNRLVALEAATGKKVWEKLFSDADGPLAFHGAPLYIANAALVVVASSEGMVFAVSATDGAILWQTSTGAPIANSATFSGERIFVMNQISGAVQCLALEDGKKLWKSAKTERCDGSLSASDKHVFFGNCLSALFAVSHQDGAVTELISLGQNREMAGGVAAWDNALYAGNRSGTLVRASVGDKATVWEVSAADTELFTTPAICGESVVIANPAGAVHCLMAGTGETRWSYRSDGYEATSTVIAADCAIVGIDGVLIGLSLTDGAVVWKQTLGDETTAPSLIANSAIVGTDDGHVIAVGTRP